MDAVVTSNDGPAWVLMNQTDTPNHWITLKLVGVKSNRDAIGAQVRISTPAGRTIRHCDYQQQLPIFKRQAVALRLGSATSIREIEIRWPSGIRQVLRDQSRIGSSRSPSR